MANVYRKKNMHKPILGVLFLSVVLVRGTQAIWMVK